MQTRNIINDIKKEIIGIKREFLIFCILLFISSLIISITLGVPILGFYKSNNGLGTIIVFIGVGIGALSIVMRRVKVELHKIVFILIMITGITTAFVMPILDSPDESSHFCNADFTSEYRLLPQFLALKDCEIIVSIDDLVEERGKTVFETDIDSSKIKYDTENFANVLIQRHIAPPNSTIGYLFSATGINVAKTLNLNLIWMLWLGRIFNVLIFSVLSMYAIKITPIYKIQLSMVCLLPMTLYQASSVSIDAILNGVCILIIAMFLYLYVWDNGSRLITYKETLLLCIFVFIAGILKITYFSLIILLLIIPSENYKMNHSLIKRILILGLFLALSICWYLFTQRNALQLPNQYSLDNNVNVIGQIMFLINNVFLGTKIILISTLNSLNYFFNQLFTFGPLTDESTFLAFIYPFFYWMISCFYPIGVTIKRSVKIYCSLLIIGVVLATYLILYITWTPIGELIVVGVQSRYFIPLLGLIPLVVGLVNNKSELSEVLFKKIDTLFFYGAPFFIILMQIGIVCANYFG